MKIGRQHTARSLTGFAGLERASVIAFWVPRDLERLPGFTTNVEFGGYVGSGRVVYGRPDGWPMNRYLDWLYGKCTGRIPCQSLADTLKEGIHMAECAEAKS